MAALGMPNPMLWGVLAALFNFIPYVGSAVTFAILVIVAFVSFDGIGYVLAVGGSYLALATIEGQVVQPLLVGNRLDLNPIIVFLALWFGGWFWGIAGIAMAIPSLVAIKVAAEHHPRGEPLLQFLSPSGAKAIKTPKMATVRKRTSLPTAAQVPSISPRFVPGGVVKQAPNLLCLRRECPYFAAELRKIPGRVSRVIYSR
jgi:hypothetical protein